jgi:hypothetical protein
MKHFDGVSDEDIEKMTWKNAARRFRFDPFAHTPREQATVGALRARASGVES